MKSTVAMLAVLLFLTMTAMAQNADLPFPQGANPALQDNAYQTAVANAPQNSPSSMAANFGGATVEVLPEYRMRATDTSNEFPMAANPSLGSPTAPEALFTGERHHPADSGIQFPMEANPSLQ